MQGGVPGQAVVVGQPAAGGPQIIGSVKGHRQWSTGLLDCFSDVKGCKYHQGYCWVNDKRASLAFNGLLRTLTFYAPFSYMNPLK